MDDFDDGDYMEMDGFEWLYVEDDFELAVRVSVQRIPLSAVGVLPPVPFFGRAMRMSPSSHARTCANMA